MRLRLRWPRLGGPLLRGVLRRLEGVILSRQRAGAPAAQGPDGRSEQPARAAAQSPLQRRDEAVGAAWQGEELKVSPAGRGPWWPAAFRRRQPSVERAGAAGSVWTPPALPWPLLAALLPGGLLLALALLPLQAAAIAGYAIQAQWHRGVPGLVDPLLPVVVFCGSLTVLAMAWGPLAAGRGSGVAAVEALQADPTLDPTGSPSPSWSPPPLQLQREHPAPILAGPTALGWRVQLPRLLLLLLAHLAGLAVGIETPAASFGASALLALRPRLKPLQQLQPPLLAAIGAGAGLGATFRSPLLGAVYALECLGGRNGSRGLALVLPTLLLAGVASLLSLDAAVPARLALPLTAALPPLLLPWALLLTLLTALVGVALRRGLLWLAPRLERRLQRRFLATALLLAAALTALAHLSGGISLNDGALELGPALAGQPEGPRWAALPRLLSPLLAVASGVPGGLPHDCMSLGALLVAPLVRRLAADQQAVLIGLGAASLFSATCRTPLLAAIFVFVLQGDAASLPLLLMASALAAGLGAALADPGPALSGQLLHVLPLAAPLAGGTPELVSAPLPSALPESAPTPPCDGLSAGRPSDGEG